MRAPAVLRDLDFASAPDEVLRACHRVHAPALVHVLPEDEPMPFEEWRGWAVRLGAVARLRHVVAEVGGEVVGFGFVELSTDDNLHLGWLDGAVAPAHRRRGIGLGLVDRLTAIARDDGRTSVGCNAAEGSPGEAFARSLGLTHRQAAQLNRLDLADVDVDVLRSWVERAADRAGGYRLRSWDGPTPPDLVDPFASCTAVMNTAPLDDLDLEEERMTPERLARIEEARLASGTSWWTIVAVEEATGRLVGFSQLSFPACRRSIAHQNDTGVDPAHRDRGLGRWIKATMLLRLLAERPEVAHVDTHNAGSNAPMLAINRTLGFRTARVTGSWQGDLDLVRTHLEARP